MLHTYYSKPQTIDRIRAHWIGEPVERYVTWMHDRGYAARNVFRRVPILLRFGTYAKAHGAQAWSDLYENGSSTRNARYVCLIGIWLTKRSAQLQRSRQR